MSDGSRKTIRRRRATEPGAFLLGQPVPWWLLSLLLLLLLPTARASTAAGLETLIGICGPDFVLLGADTAVGPGVVWTATRVDKIAALHSAAPDPDSHCLLAAAGDAADADYLVGLLQAQAALHTYQHGVGTVTHVRVVSSTGRDSDDRTPNVWTTPSPAAYTVTQAAHLARAQIAQRLRSQSPCKVCLLVAGVQQSQVSQLGNGAEATQRLQRQILQATRTAITHPKEEEGGVTDATATPPVVAEKSSDDNGAPFPYLYWIDELGTLIQLPYGSHGIGSMFVNAVLDEGYHPQLTRKEAYQLMQKCFGQLRQRYAIRAPQPPVIKCIDRHGVHRVLDDSDYL